MNDQRGGSVLANGEVDPVYQQISKLEGDPISAGYLRTYTFASPLHYGPAE